MSEKHPAVKAILDELGHEIVSDQELAAPVHFGRRSTLQDVREALGIISREAADAGSETFEEADDFDVGDVDDLMIQSRYDHPYDNELDGVLPPPPPPASAAPVPPPPTPDKQVSTGAPPEVGK